ncbi:TetR/AcrR family transcriptional regulator C-terminal domain-containing protein [Lacticaseibacillus sp. 866-1]|uniref:TetR/AcrR family transcriptional regulator C-terminal domain-containing protein n=1 Tax=Lacticaseibacillus sp. 866-1 TaxID=2799576 RepID=UPI0019428D8F|nr:TetR/AcrR family transcriptional regulator C-terminal domain-containing protein [Lacticaseibacillus sp. 866-1]
MKNEAISLATNRRFSAALKAALRTRPFEDITVQQLLTATGMARPTFYYHFDDLFGLLQWTFADEALSLLQKDSDYTHWEEDVYRLLVYLANNADLYANFYANITLEQVQAIFCTPMLKILNGYIQAVITARQLTVSAATQQFVAEFFVGGFVSVLVRWLKAGLPESPAALRQQLHETMDQIIVQVLEKANKTGNLSDV